MTSGTWCARESSEVRLVPDHVHMIISIQSRYAVSQEVGFIKDRSAIQLAHFRFF